MTNRFRRELPTVARYLDDRIVRWRTGTTEGQLLVLSALVGLTMAIALSSLLSYSAFPAASFVIPILLGSADAALTAAQTLADKGFFVPAIRYPTVPKDAARLRVTLSARHTPEQIRALCEALREITNPPPRRLEADPA